MIGSLAVFCASRFSRLLLLYQFFVFSGGHYRDIFWASPNKEMAEATFLRFSRRIWMGVHGTVTVEDDSLLIRELFGVFVPPSIVVRKAVQETSVSASLYKPDYYTECGCVAFELA